MIFIIPVAVFAATLAFYEVNGRPFIVVLEHAFGYLLGNKLYLWRPRTTKPLAKQDPAAASQQPLLPVPKLSESRLKDLAWSLNIKDRATMSAEETKVRTGFEI